MSQDLYNKAVKWALEQPELQQVMWDAYVTYDTQIPVCLRPPIKDRRDSALLRGLIAWYLSHKTAQLYSFCIPFVEVEI